MRLHAELRRKQSEIQDENCIVTDIIELPESEYASLYQNLLRERRTPLRLSDRNGNGNGKGKLGRRA